MTGNALAMAGAFSFILLSIWMAMCLGQIFEDAIEFTSFGFSFPASLLILSVLDVRHAAVSAQSFEARLLTQMVRLPIPSWQDGGGWNSREFAVGLVVSCLPMGRFLSEDLTHSEQYKNIVGISQVQLMCNCRADAPTNRFRNIRQ